MTCPGSLPGIVAAEGVLIQISFFTGEKTAFLPVNNPLPFLPVKYKFYQLISETKITLKK